MRATTIRPLSAGPYPAISRHSADESIVAVAEANRNCALTATLHQNVVLARSE